MSSGWISASMTQDHEVPTTWDDVVDLLSREMGKSLS